MDLDTDKIDDAVLALLRLTLHDGCRAWKGHDWDAMDRLYKKGMIHNPIGKAKSVVLTDEGLERSKALFAEMFARWSWGGRYGVPPSNAPAGPERLDCQPYRPILLAI